MCCCVMLCVLSIKFLAHMKTVQQTAEKWAHNSLAANPDRIFGIMQAYFSGKQSLKWAVGLLKDEDFENLVSPILKSLKGIDDYKFDALVAGLRKS